MTNDRKSDEALLEALRTLKAIDHMAAALDVAQELASREWAAERAASTVRIIISTEELQARAKEILDEA